MGVACFSWSQGFLRGSARFWMSFNVLKNENFFEDEDRGSGRGQRGSRQD